MQVIKIIIRDGKAQSVEISEMKKPKTTKDIEAMLRAMPKEMLAEALGISNGSGVSMAQSNISMPIKAKPYQHQIDAFNFTCKLFGLVKGGDAPTISISNSCSLLMEMVKRNRKNNYHNCSNWSVIQSSKNQTLS